MEVENCKTTTTFVIRCRLNSSVWNISFISTDKIYHRNQFVSTDPSIPRLNMSSFKEISHCNNASLVEPLIIISLACLDTSR